jgi:hypothetical protein
MTTSRPTPFDFAFSGAAEERFPAIRKALVAAGRDPRDRDAFLMERAVVELLREIRPEEGVGEAMDEFVALVHLAWLFWADGARVVPIGEEQLTHLTRESPAIAAGPTSATYVQLPPRKVWGLPVAGSPAEPLDGWFVAPHGGEIQAAAVFGLHPDRAGFSVVAVDGPRPEGLVRGGGDPLFAPVLAGGDAAGLYSVTGMEELLELVWRALPLSGVQS